MITGTKLSESVDLEKKYSKFFKKHFVNSLYYYERVQVQWRKIDLYSYPSEIISINDFAPCGSLEPLNLLIKCWKLLQAHHQVQLTNSGAPQLPASGTHIFNEKWQKSPFITRTGEPGRQAGRAWFIPHLLDRREKRALGGSTSEDSWEVMAGESDARFSGSFRLAVFKQQVVTHYWVLKSI